MGSGLRGQRSPSVASPITAAANFTKLKKRKGFFKLKKKNIEEKWNKKNEKKSFTGTSNF